MVVVVDDILVTRGTLILVPKVLYVWGGACLIALLCRVRSVSSAVNS